LTATLPLGLAPSAPLRDTGFQPIRRCFVGGEPARLDVDEGFRAFFRSLVTFAFSGGFGTGTAAEGATQKQSAAPKAKAYNTCIAPQAAYRSGAVHVTDRAGVQLFGHS